MIYIVVTLILMYFIGAALAICTLAAVVSKNFHEKGELSDDR